jgi:hypothetical protein
LAAYFGVVQTRAPHAQDIHVAHGDEALDVKSRHEATADKADAEAASCRHGMLLCSSKGAIRCCGGRESDKQNPEKGKESPIVSP